LTPRQLALPLTAAPAPPALAAPSVPAAPATPEIRFVRRRGTRRYILRVLDDGSVRVTVPWSGSQREARAFVESQAAWIARQRLRLAEASAVDRRWRAGSAVLIDGNPVPLILDTDADTVRLRCGGELVGEVEAGADDLKRVVQRWLRRRAALALPVELQALAATHAVTVARVSIRNQQARWGSCSRRGSITLNWRLVQVPPFVREYVLVHELMHRRELNHSARFWRHVAAACPRYLEARRWLHQDGAALF
jgi:predicted metal-dependent hydrolase